MYESGRSFLRRPECVFASPICSIQYLVSIRRLTPCASAVSITASGVPLARPRLALNWLDVRNEDAIGDFEGEMKKVCAFLDIPWQTSLKRFSESARRQNIATPSSAQVRAGLSGESVGHWRLYKEQLRPVLPVLEPWAEKFGYPAV